MVQAHVIITGDVIGVGFRQYIQNHAQNLNLTGWVKNIYSPQKVVEAVFQGEKEDIDKMIELCKQGPEISLVSKVSHRYIIQKENFRTFSILR